MSDPGKTINQVMHESLRLRLAFEDLVRRVCRTSRHASTVPLQEVIEGIEEMGDRASALLYANRHADTLTDADALREELLSWLREDRRPRQLRDAIQEESRLFMEDPPPRDLS